MGTLSRAVVEAPGKINLFLDIKGRLENGYHLLETVMQAVSLTDIVVVGRSASEGIRVTCSRPGVPEDECNLAYRAAACFLAETGTAPAGGLHIHIDKRIPPEAGLGGGSADAAAVLVGLNRLLERNLAGDSLCGMALALGADVPFAVKGGCALARGVGERLTALSPGLGDCRIVIAKPGGGISTPEAYARYDAAVDPAHRDSGDMLSALTGGDPAAAGRALFNVFEQVTGASRAIKKTMLDHGALGAVLSGSGSAVAGLFRGPEQAGACFQALNACAEERFVCEPVPYGARLLHIS